MRTQIIVLAVASLVAPLASAAPDCTQQMTRGHWMYTCEGQLPVGAPNRALGTCDTSRTGVWTCSGKVNAGGAVLDQEMAGRANNAPNCTGTISYTQTIGGTTLPGTLDIFYVISDNGSSINGLPLNSGGVLACSLKRLSIE